MSRQLRVVSGLVGLVGLVAAGLTSPGAAVAVGATTPTLAPVVTIELVSQSPQGVETPWGVARGQISANGASVLFEAYTSSSPQLYARLRNDQRTVLVSGTSSGAPATGGVTQSTMLSADGSTAFFTWTRVGPSNLTASGDTRSRVFVKRLQSGALTSILLPRVPAAHGGPRRPQTTGPVAVTRDGRYVTVGGYVADGSGLPGVYRYDRVTHTWARLCGGGTGGSDSASCGFQSASGDGRYLVLDDGVTLKDLRTGSTRSLHPQAHGAGKRCRFTGDSTQVVCDHDYYAPTVPGQHVTSITWRRLPGLVLVRKVDLSRSAVVTGTDATGAHLSLDSPDALSYDAATGALTPLAVTISGELSADHSGSYSMSDDGEVAFASQDDHLVANDPGGRLESFFVAALG